MKHQSILKDILMFCAAFPMLLLSLESKAQYATPSLYFDSGDIITNEGQVLTAFEIRQVIGEDAYFRTYRGARKQYKAGSTLITCGAIGFGVGAVATGLSLASLNPDSPQAAFSSGMRSVFGTVVMSMGLAALQAGIPFKIIGRNRLRRLVDDYNGQQLPEYSFKFEETPNGVGLVMRF